MRGGHNKHTPETFWSRVDVRAMDECWPFDGSTNNTGYGSVSYQGMHCTPHRVAAHLFGFVDSPMAPKDRKGGGFVLHQCDSRTCCNPGHFKIGTYGENQSEAYARGRRIPPPGGYNFGTRKGVCDARRS